MKPPESDRRFILVLGLIYAFCFIDRTIIAVLGESIRRDLGLSDLELGVLGGLSFALFYAGLGIPLARLAEQRNRVRLIATVTVIWSVMTALSGAAGGFLPLLLCRIGVGIGEAGLTPALVSMLADRFPAQRRAASFSLIALGAPAGSALAAIGGGIAGQLLGWRGTFVVVGLPGLLLAWILLRNIGEPPRREAETVPPPGFGAVLRRLGRSPAYLHLTAASALVALVGYGLNLFTIPLLVRRYGLELGFAGPLFAVSISLAIGLGSALGGIAADRLGRRDVGWYAWAPACLLGLAAPAYVAALLQSDWRLFVAFAFPASAALYAFLPAIMTVTQALVEPRMRASAAAIHAFGQTVGGLGLGAVLLGFLSDRFAAGAFVGDYARACAAGGRLAPDCLAASATGLQSALLAAAIVLPLAALHYWRAGLALRREAAGLGGAHAGESPARDPSPTG